MNAAPLAATVASAHESRESLPRGVITQASSGIRRAIAPLYFVAAASPAAAPAHANDPIVPRSCAARVSTSARVMKNVVGISARM